MSNIFLKPKDYGRIVRDGLLLPKRFWINHYTHEIVNNLPDNPDMFTELKIVLNELIEWYKGQVRGGTVPTKMPDGTIKYFDRNQTWESDGDGDFTKWVKHDLYENEIFLLPINSEITLGKNVKVNKAYFENHLRIIEDIERKEKLSYILERIKTNIENHKDNTKPSSTDLKKVMSIPTKATKDEILNFWFKLQGNKEKGDPYWESEQDIEHFVYQNFEGFPGVNEKKEFNPNMNKSELNQVTWTFLHTYGESKGKKQYVNLLLKNFTQFRGAKDVYGNIKFQNNEHLRKLYKEFSIK